MTVTGHCATFKCHKQPQFTAQAPLPMLPAVPGVALLGLNEQNNFNTCSLGELHVQVGTLPSPPSKQQWPLESP